MFDGWQGPRPYVLAATGSRSLRFSGFCRRSFEARATGISVSGSLPQHISASWHSEPIVPGFPAERPQIRISRLH